MAEYNITVDIHGVTLVDLEAEEIRDALSTLEGDNRLSATYIKDLPEGLDPVTPADIVNDINSLGGSAPLINGNQLGAILKSNIVHGENSLNWIFTGDPDDAAFKALYQPPNTDRVKKMDIIIIDGSSTYNDGDWLIALADNPGFNYADTTKWLLLALSSVSGMDAILAAIVFAKNSNDDTAGIQSVPGNCDATGEHSFAPGVNNVAEGDASTALGNSAKATRQGEVAEASKCFTTPGDFQRARSGMTLITTNATPTVVTLPQKFEFEEDKTYLTKVTIIGVVLGGKKAKSWEYKFLSGIDSDGYVPVAGGQLTDESLSYGSPTFSATASIQSYSAGYPPAPGAFKGIDITCTGVLNTTVKWGVYIETFEISSSI